MICRARSAPLVATPSWAAPGLPWAGSRRAPTALAWVVGDSLGSVEADGYAGAVALGNFHGEVSAGESGFILTQGVIDGSLTAGEDAWLWAIGDEDATVSAGHDAAATARRAAG